MLPRLFSFFSVMYLGVALMFMFMAVQHHKAASVDQREDFVLRLKPKLGNGSIQPPAYSSQHSVSQTHSSSTSHEQKSQLSSGPLWCPQSRAEGSSLPGIFFMHVPKAAGTSVRSVISNNLKRVKPQAKNFFYVTGIGSCDGKHGKNGHGPWVVSKKCLEPGIKADFVTGHIYLHSMLDHLSSWKTHNRIFLSMIRDPESSTILSQNPVM